MEIQYLMNIPRHGFTTMRKKKRIGIVQQVTPKLIAVQGERYPETILVSDLISGQAEILGLKRGEDKMAGKSPYNWDELGLKIDDLRAEGKAIQKIADELGIGYSTVHRYLNKQEKQAQEPAPAQVGSQEPVQATQEPAKEIISEENRERYTYCDNCKKKLDRFKSEDILIGTSCYDTKNLKTVCHECFKEYQKNNNLPEQGCPFDEPIYNPEPVKMPIGCALPLEDTEKPDNDNNTVETQIDWPPKDDMERAMIYLRQRRYGKSQPKDAIERAMIESSVNAQLAVRRVINDPVALALIKELMARGAV